MFQAIQVTMYGPTNTKPQRVRAKASAGTLWGKGYWSHDNADDAALAIATKFANKYDWLDEGRTLQGGVIHDGSWVFVIVEQA